MITMASLAGAYVYQDAARPLAEAFGTSASAGFVGALFGWCLASALQWAPDRTVQQEAATKATTVRDSGATGVRTLSAATCVTNRPTGSVNMKRGVIMGAARADAEPGLRILLVERDPIDAAVLVQLMRASQDASDVFTAASFSAAADVLRREAIDAIFCTLATQDMELFRALIRTAKGRPVVALVAQAESEIRDQAMQAGAVRAVCKERLLASFAQRVVRAVEACPDRMPAYA